MILAYLDESGDDGYPNYSSDFFVLVSVYMSQNNWKENYNKIKDFRKLLKDKTGMPFKIEMHTKEFLFDKDPYHGIFTPRQRKSILIAICNFISTLKLKAISVSIDKKRINRPEYSVLENALMYNVQRIENDLSKNHNDESFLLITDEGRVAMMREITRKMQVINYVPSMFLGSQGSNQVVKRLIEDPLPKSSEQSYFIQIADTIAYLVLLYSRLEWGGDNQPSWPKRLGQVIQPSDVILLLNALSPILNTNASKSNRFGIVHYPK